MPEEKLKTLKELPEIWFKHHEEDINSMCSSKTEDCPNGISINWASDGRKWIETERLRKEAIKWIKRMEEIEKSSKESWDSTLVESGKPLITFGFGVNGETFRHEPFEDDEFRPIKKFIKCFFNITEEDLK